MVVKPLYSIIESVLHWYITYPKYHIEQLVMQRTRADPFHIGAKDGWKAVWISGHQVDDSLSMVSKAFMAAEER